MVSPHLEGAILILVAWFAGDLADALALIFAYPVEQTMIFHRGYLIART